MRTKVIIGVIILVLLLAGGAFAFMNMSKTKAPVADTNPESDKSKSAFSTVQDIFTNKSLSLSCDYTDPEGRKTKTYIKNGSVRADVTAATAENSGSVIATSDTMYFWNGTQGVMMKYDPEQMKEAMNGGNSQDAQGQAALQGLEAYKESCKPAVVDDSLFTPPSNVKFQDMSEMMKMIPTGAGANGTVPSIDPTKYQQMMQQYQTP